MNIDMTLQERGARYGSFEEHARITQNIKKAMADSPNWATLPPNMREALEMVAHKAGRILNGDPMYHDSWHDIVGYTKLVADELLPKPANDNGEWIKWTGDGVIPDVSNLFDVKVRNGNEFKSVRLSNSAWIHCWGGFDITAYRIVKGA